MNDRQDQIRESDKAAPDTAPGTTPPAGTSQQREAQPRETQIPRQAEGSAVPRTTANRPDEPPPTPPALGAPHNAAGDRTPGSDRTTAGKDRTSPATRAGAESPRHGHGDGGLGERLQRAIGAFVDEPRKSVEEADAVLEQATRQLTEKLAERRRILRSAWHDDDAKADTEELRLALMHYRDLTQQLLSI
ncbi:hypothetical protein QMK19_22785 [Streptomyces sp. H10-C2]|uniref:hypothetical protein n=1 Tax=unclassified Streptomyces TaxID=2593676 RepID=UPI0024BAF2E6|nr:MULTISPECIES: hypothetical protein [unclassified Streptomyces]MDJ0343660.1 hypothetical protein [Streptomyces sp. PH10-H1]MDJ0372413.1 hypothetical protein [Streptomyces sp. H10-C2]